MKIIKELPGAYSSKVELVEIDKCLFVLKTWDEDETQNEKLFLRELKEHGLPALRVIENNKIRPNQILLEYINGSPTLPQDHDYFIAFGESVRKMHDITYDYSFKVNSKGEREKIEWNDFLRDALNRGLQRQAKKGTDLDKSFLDAIASFVKNRLPVTNISCSLLHADLHTENVLMRGDDMLLYDKNSEIFSGDSRYDVVTLLTNFPNGVYIETSNSENQQDTDKREAFIKGYGSNFLENDREILDLYFVIKALARYPNPWEIHLKEALENIVLGRS